MAAQYSANIEITFQSLDFDYSDVISAAFFDSDTYAHAVTQTEKGKYLLSFSGNGIAEWHNMKKCCMKLAKNTTVRDYYLSGEMHIEGSSDDYYDAIRAKYNNGEVLFEYWSNCYSEDGDLDDVYRQVAPSVYDKTYIDSVYIMDCRDSVVGVYIENKSNIKEIVVTGNAKLIQSKAFEAFHRLEKVLLPDSIMYIESSAFVNCERLTQVSIPKNLKAIYENSFSNCPKLEISVPLNVLVIKPDGCSKYKELLFDSISRMDKEDDIKKVFELVTIKELIKAAEKLEKREGKSGCSDSEKVSALLKCFSDIDNKIDVEHTFTDLFSSSFIEKLKTKYAVAVGVMKDISADEICRETGVKPSTVSSVKSSISGWRCWSDWTIEWFITYCL